MPPVTLPAGGLALGRSGGIALEALSTAGRWVSYCQGAPGRDVTIDARGNPEEPIQLFLQVGERVETIDALLAIDPSGRFLVTLRDGEAWLVDSATDRQVSLRPLSPDLRFDALADHRSFSFGPDGATLAVLGDGTLLALDTLQVLQTGGVQAESRRVAWSAGAGTPWRITASDAHLVVHLAEGDWPVPARLEASLRCSAGITPFAAFADDNPPRPRGDVSVQLLKWQALRGADSANAESSPSSKQGDHPSLVTEPAPGFVMSFGENWVRRTNEGRLLLVEGRTQRQIASSRCGGRILHADTRSGWFLIACEQYEPAPSSSRHSNANKRKKPRYRFELYLLKPGRVVDLEADLMRTGVDIAAQPGPRFVPLRPGADAALVDFEQARLIRLDEGLSVLGTSDQGAVLRDGRMLSFFDGKNTTPLEVELPPFAPLVESAFGLAWPGHLLEWGTRTLHEQVDPLVALGPMGHRVVTRAPATTERWARGPLSLLPPPGQAPLGNDDGAADENVSLSSPSR